MRRHDRPMKVAFVVGQFPALSETFILDQVTGLLDRGVEVDIYAADRRPQPALHPAVRRYALVERTTYARSEPERTGVKRAWVLRLLLASAARARTSKAWLRRVVRHGRADANTALRFRHVVRNGGRHYDVIHCHFGPFGLWGMALRNMGVLSGRLVTTFHGYDLSRVVQAEGPDVYQRLFEEGDHFLPISRFWRDRLIDLGCDPARISVHRMGVDTANFSFAPRSLPVEETFHILTVGRLTEKKGIADAIRAVALFRECRGGSGPSVQHTIIGDGPLRPALEGLIRELGLEGCVHLVGAQPRDRVSAAMNRAHVLLAPSVTAPDGNQEGVPMVLMEAMASGVAVLSTVHTGIPELVEPEETGLLVEEGDVGGIARALDRLLEDPAGYARMTGRARKRVEEEFDVRRLNDQLFERFRTLCEDAGNGGRAQ